MIEFDRLNYSYPAGDAGQPPLPVLRDVSLHIREGEFVLVTGPSGAGKSTLLRCINGLVPHFYGGEIEGRVRVAGRDPTVAAPRGMSDVVGFVFQDPEAQSVVDVVEDEIAFALENQGTPMPTMRARIEETLEQLDIAHLRRRALSSLSGGERQRVAIAAALVLHPSVLVLDEPTSQLDPQSAEEVLDTVVRLNRDLGLTIVLSEHRLERVVQHADRILHVPGGGEPPQLGDPREILAGAALVPPLVELARRLGVTPLPLTIEEARSLVVDAVRGAASGGHTGPVSQSTVASENPPGKAVLEIRGLAYAYNGHAALRGVDLTIRQGEFVAVVGHNGAGKTTLLKLCIGLLKPGAGSVRAFGHDTQRIPVEQLARRVGYVPQNPNALLFADTVAQELAFTRRAQGLQPSDDRRLLRTVGLDGMQARYPRDLSTGERQRVALAAVLVSDPDLIMLDEPTRGLDYVQKDALGAFLREQQSAGKTVLVVTHDVELVAQCAERVVVMADGEIAVDGPVREVMSGSEVFASQVSRLLRDPRYLTVEDVVGRA